MSGQKKKELFKEFLSKNVLMVADKSSASRRRLVKTLVDMGAKRNQIHSVAHFAEALEIINNEKPKLVLSDFRLKGGSGFDLFKAYREQDQRLNDTALVMITSNITQSAVAKAAEEDVDSFIIKPYTVKSLEKSLVTSVINKLYPGAYMKTIDEGKVLLLEGRYEEALPIFEKAIGLSKEPSLAYFYHGQTKYFMRQVEGAQSDYNDGLSINRIHFKCQVGLFDIFMNQEKYSEAYEVVRNIAKYFPANPDRLMQVVRLAVLTHNYEDISDYYEIFKTLEERPLEVVNYVCSGLYVLGRYKFFQGDKESAKEIFDQVAVSCMGEAKFLKALVVKLAQEGCFPSAQEVLKRFSAQDHETEAYKISDYVANIKDMSPTEQAGKGLELFNAGIKDPDAMKFTLKALKNSQSNKYAQYLEEAVNEWPDIFSFSSQPLDVVA